MKSDFVGQSKELEFQFNWEAIEGFKEEYCDLIYIKKKNGSDFGLEVGEVAGEEFRGH